VTRLWGVMWASGADGASHGHGRGAVRRGDLVQAELALRHVSDCVFFGDALSGSDSRDAVLIDGKGPYARITVRQSGKRSSLSPVCCTAV
jgi:hypothetical protein